MCGFDKPVTPWYTAWWGAAAGWPGAASFVSAWPPWAGSPGAQVAISAVAPAASVQLAVNGALVGAPIAVPRLGFASWSVPFAPGNYTVASFDAAGAQVGLFVSRSPGPAAALRAVVDWPGSGPGGALIGDRRDAALVAVAVVDASGEVVRGAQVNVTFTVSGPGELLGLGNGASLRPLLVPSPRPPPSLTYTPPTTRAHARRPRQPCAGNGDSRAPDV